MAKDRAELDAKPNGTQTASEPMQNSPTTNIELPEDPSKAVITMVYVGGFRDVKIPTPTIPSPGSEPQIEQPIEIPKPFLVVQADGTVLSAGKVLKKLTVAELKALLRFVVVENAFFDFDKASGAAIAAKEERIRRQREDPDDTKPVEVEVLEGDVLPVDMATTVITVEVSDRKHTTKCYGNSILASHDYYKDVEPIQQMHRIEQKLRSLTQ